MTKFTPGPWLVSDGPSMHGWPVVTTNSAQPGRLICRLNHASKYAEFGPQAGDRAFNAEALANGRLIAAAPELYEALEAMMRHSCVAEAALEDKHEGDHEAEALALQAMAKARGAA